MEDMDCGLYLLTQTSTEVKKLSRLNRFMNNFMETLVIHKYFDTIAVQLLKHIRQIIPAKDLRFLVQKPGEDLKILEQKNRFRGTVFEPDDTWKEMIPLQEKACPETYSVFKNTIILPLTNKGSQEISVCALIETEENTEMDDETMKILEQVKYPLSIAIEREMIQQQLDQEKQSFYEMSIKDNLTGLYNRTYMNETIPRLLAHHDRSVFNGLALLMLDLDHFKSVNDTYGHAVGDRVLKKQPRRSKINSAAEIYRCGSEEKSLLYFL